MCDRSRSVVLKRRESQRPRTALSFLLVSLVLAALAWPVSALAEVHPSPTPAQSIELNGGTIIHLPKPADFNKLSYRIVDLEVPDDSIVSPAGSMDVPQAVGEAVLPSHLAFIVPSFANSLERNVVLNPEHPSFSQVTPGVLRPFFLDHRLGP